MNHYALLTLLVTCIFISESHVHTIYNMKELKQYIPENKQTLIIFDIDNTIATTKQELGSDEWFQYSLNTLIANGTDYRHALYKLLPTWYMIQFSVPLVPTEKDIPELIKEYNAQDNIHTMALTARGLYIAERTLEQLHNIPITFKPPYNNTTQYTLPLMMPCMYFDGILFSGENDKGVTLVCFLDTIGYHPEQIVFIDDKMKNIDAIEEALFARNIACTCILYTYCNEKVKQFNPKHAEEQLQKLYQERNTINA